MAHWIIFTDLDGTLLHHETYDFKAAEPALEKIRALNIPLIINSSKTANEIRKFCQKMHLNSAFITENGACIYIPESEQKNPKNSYQEIILGIPYITITTLLAELRDKYDFKFQGFNDLSISQLIELTGLNQNEASDAKQRSASEPILWQDTENQKQLFKQLLQQNQLRLVKGGRFDHVMGHNDKSTAMAWLLDNYYTDTQMNTIALGDSPNDMAMLEQADLSAVIRKPDGNYMSICKNPAQVYYAKQSAPDGWQESIDFLLAKLNLQESLNE